MTFADPVYNIGLQFGRPAVVATFEGERTLHVFETAEKAIRFYERCLDKPMDSTLRERFLRACRARWN